MPHRFFERHIGLTAFAIYLTLLLVAGSGAVFAWLVFSDPASPYISHKLIQIDAVVPDRGEPYLLSTRHFCFKEKSEAQAIRVFRRLPDGVRDFEEVIETLPTIIHLDAGCYARTRRVDLPDSMRPGRWSYRTGFRWCRALNNCATVWLPEVILTLDFQQGVHRLSIQESP